MQQLKFFVCSNDHATVILVLYKVFPSFGENHIYFSVLKRFLELFQICIETLCRPLDLTSAATIFIEFMCIFVIFVLSKTACWIVYKLADSRSCLCLNICVYREVLLLFSKFKQIFEITHDVYGHTLARISVRIEKGHVCILHVVSLKDVH